MGFVSETVAVNATSLIRGSLASSDNVTVILAAVGAAIALILSIGWLGIGQGLDEGEPPLIRSFVPFGIGHLVGLLWGQIGYLEELHFKYNLPIYTLKIFTGRLYVICDPSLVHAVFRDDKAFTFMPHAQHATEALASLSEDGKRIIRATDEPDGNYGQTSFMLDFHKVTYEYLAPGSSLVQLNARVLNTVASYFNEIGVEGTSIDLQEWMGKCLVTATTDAFYGPGNPFRADPTLIDRVWEFERQVIILMLDILPSVTARGAYHARQAIDKALQEYFKLGYDKEAGRVVIESANSSSRWGISKTDNSNLEILRVFVSVTNTVPSSFWLLSYILSDDELLGDIRAEISGIVTRAESSMSMDITKFHSHCPLYVSTWQETLRHISANGAVRDVKFDTMLSDMYLLKKGSSIQMPAGVLHRRPSTWGNDVESFDAHRFLKANELPREQRKAQASSYVSFGGGKHLCPGRHLAATEVLSFVATLLLGYEFEGFRMLPKQLVKIGTGVKKPKGNLHLVVKRRQEFKDITWSYFVGGEVDFAKLSSAEHIYES